MPKTMSVYTRAAYLAASLIYLTACSVIEEEPLQRPPAPVQWRQEATYGQALALTNSLEASPTALWVGHDQWLSSYSPTAFPSAYLASPHVREVPTPVGRYTAARAGLLSQYACGSNAGLTFVSLAQPVLQGAQRSLVLPLGSAPRYVNFLNSTAVGVFGALQGTAQRFLTIATANSGSINDRHAAILVTVNVSPDLERVSLTDTLAVPLIGTFSSSCQAPTAIRYVRDHFYVSFGSGATFRISGSGTQLNIGNSFGGFVSDFFEGDSAMIYAHVPSTGILWRSVDNGLSWLPWGNVTTDFARFRRVGNSVVFFNPGIRDLIWLDLARRRVTRLDLTGLGFYTIQDVALYNGRVFIATWGGGLYSKPIENLLDPVPGS